MDIYIIKSTVKRGQIHSYALSIKDPHSLFFWSKMACAGVPHIVLHVFSSTRTSGGHFRPSEVRFRGILALSGDLFYTYKIFKLDFLKTLPSPNFDLLDS